MTKIYFSMAKETITKTITIPKLVWKLGVKASVKMFGKKNFSGYVQSLIIKDCKGEK